MTIDEAENYLISLKYCKSCGAANTNLCESCPYCIRDGLAERRDAINVGIDIMRKYQKIEDIYYHQTGQALENSLREVIEDGGEY